MLGCWKNGSLFLLQEVNSNYKKDCHFVSIQKTLALFSIPLWRQLCATILWNPLCDQLFHNIDVTSYSLLTLLYYLLRNRVARPVEISLTLFVSLFVCLIGCLLYSRGLAWQLSIQAFLLKLKNYFKMEPNLILLRL